MDRTAESRVIMMAAIVVTIVGIVVYIIAGGHIVP